MTFETTIKIVKIIITSVSLADFLVFSILFSIYLGVVQYKTPKINPGSLIALAVFITFKVLHIPVFLSTIDIIWSFTDSLLITFTVTNIILAATPLLTSTITFFSKKSEQNCSETKHVNIVMPIYNEDPEILWRAIQSVKNLDYNHSKMHLYLAFDSREISGTYSFITGLLGLDPLVHTDTILKIHDGMYITIARFNHGGKKSAQYGAFREIRRDYTDCFLENSLLFLIDSDIQLRSDCLAEFTATMHTKNKSCLTGLITCSVSDTPNFLGYYQDIEYISGQIFWRNMENYMGATTCLPGAFTIMEWRCFEPIADDYFSKTKYDDNFDYQRFYLGEDRYLTHLLMEREPWKIGFCETARCKTKAPETIRALLKQRRRWYLGHIANDTWLISSLKLWKIYPLLSLFNFLNNSRNTSIYIYLIYFILYTNKSVSPLLWFIYIILPILLNWLFVFYYSIRLGRKMNILFYFAIVLCQPVFNMLFMYYTIFTWHMQTWGGVRVESPPVFHLGLPV